jgi:hypothetical protein
MLGKKMSMQHSSLNKLSFKTREEIIIFTDKQKTEYILRITASQEILKEILHIEGQ